MNRRFPALVSLIVIALIAGCQAPPRHFTSEQVAERAAKYEDEAFAQRQAVASRLLARLIAKKAECDANGASMTFDVLALSSGGQYGAFGVGYLQGWSSVRDHPLAQPRFDAVTGVSTGALIAPFALIGSEDSIKRVEQLYEQVDDSLAVMRGFLFFLPWEPSFYDNRKLAARIDQEMDEAMLRAIADAHAEHRMLFIGATDLDLGRFQMFDMGPEAARAIETGDATRFQKQLLASASIPAAFPPVELDGTLYADGAASQAAFVGLDRDQIVGVFNEYQRRTGAPCPRVRFWIIVNGAIDPKPELCRQAWIPIAARSLATLTSYSLRTTLRHLEFGCEVIGDDIGGAVEFRYVSIPDNYPLEHKSKSMFDQELMAKLRRLGTEMGADPTTWQTTVGAPELPGSESKVRTLKYD